MRIQIRVFRALVKIFFTLGSELYAFMMKKTRFIVLCTCIFVITTTSVFAQEYSIKTAETVNSEEDDASVMYKFEPDFLTKNEERKTKIAETKKIIDTLDISNRKRLKLLKDLYKNGLSKRLKKALLVKTDFDDIEE